MYECFQKSVHHNLLKTLISEKNKDGIQTKHPWRAFSKKWHENISLRPHLNLRSAITCTCVLKKATHCMEYKREDFVPFRSKEWVISEWPIRSRDRTDSSLRLKRQDARNSFIFGLSGSVCLRISFPTHFARAQWRNCSNVVFKSEKGVCSSETSPSRASLTAESVAELPLMPTWPGTQTKTISFPSRIKSEYSSWFFFYQNRLVIFHDM